MIIYLSDINYADMAELADAHGSGPCGATRAGSSHVIRTKLYKTAVSKGDCFLLITLEQKSKCVE